MTVRRLVLAGVAVAGLVFAAGCGGGDNVTLTAETDEPLHVLGLQQKRQDRNSEALVSFLKLIDKRGEQASAESHFEAGYIFLKHNKDYIEAIHHFQKYLALKPNSPQAPHVRELINTAKREFARSLPARPPEDQAFVRFEGSAELDQLLQENAELKAALATLRGGGASPVNRAARGFLPPDAMRTPVRPAVVDESPLSVAPRPVVNTPPPLPPPATSRPARSNPLTPTAAPAPAGRRHRVAQGETLFSIAKKYDAANVSKKMNAILTANPAAFPGGNINALRLGADLVIP